MRNLLIVLVLAPVTTALADEPATVAPVAPAASARTHVVVGLHVGAAIPVASPPGAFVLPMLEVGVIPAGVGGRFEPFVFGGWTRLPAKGEGEDPRLAGGAYTWSGSQQEGLVGAGLHVRFLPLDAPVNGYVGLAGAAAIGQTRIDGESGGATFGENIEDEVSGAILADLGGEVSAGPGRVFVALDLLWTPLHGVISGDRSLTMLAPTVGYRFVF